MASKVTFGANGFDKVHPGEGLKGCEQKCLKEAEYLGDVFKDPFAMEYADVELKDLSVEEYPNCELKEPSVLDHPTDELKEPNAVEYLGGKLKHRLP